MAIARYAMALCSTDGSLSNWGYVGMEGGAVSYWAIASGHDEAALTEETYMAHGSDGVVLFDHQARACPALPAGTDSPSPT